MRYTIGIGALINEPWYNHIRNIQVELGDTTRNFSSLAQPPHVTIKRRFEVDGIAGIRRCEHAMVSLADKNKAFNIRFAGIGNFGDDVLFSRVITNDSLTSMHSQLLKTLEPVFLGSTTTLEGDSMVFHLTLAMGLEPAQFHTARQLLGTYPEESLAFTTPVTKLGLFLGIDNNTHWAVAAEAKLV